jgi:23S rRNA (guanine745-N1)-methyltransferase
MQAPTAADVRSVFGPRHMPEIGRLLEADGSLILVTPTVRHLAELVDRLGLVTVDPRKQSRMDELLQGWSRVSDQVVEHTVAMNHGDVLDNVLMGPSAHHVDADALAAKIDALADPITVTVSVTVSVVKPSQ